MHHSTKRRVALGMTTGGLLLSGIGMGVAQADASADGAAAQSPGLLSGNLLQIPVNAPINVCGNGVDVIGVLDSVIDNHCGNASAPAGSAANGASAHGGAADSPGAGSGNLVQIPINAPINVCGNSISGVGIGDTAAGNTCENGAGPGSNGASANGGSHGSPGAGSGNTVQLPVNTPINLCGNQASGVGIGDTAAGNACENGRSAPPPAPPVVPPGNPTPPPCGCQPTVPNTPAVPTHSRSHVPTATPGGSLAETGTGARNVVAPLGASMLGGGGLLLRKRLAGLRDLTSRQR